MTKKYAIQIVEPEVQLITNEEWFKDLAITCEIAGRESHRSEGAMKTGSHDPFLRKVAFKLGHESIIEHANVTVRFIGSRAMSHQLVRHRIAAYTQESQRFCDYSHPKWGDTLQVICPPEFGIEPGKVFTQKWEGSGTVLGDSFRAAVLHAYEFYLMLREEGAAAEDARFVLPNAARTSVVTTYNLRQWRHFFRMRCDKHAQWEIRWLAKETLRMFLQLLPCCFDDQTHLLEG